MALLPSQRLGPYEILSAIGAGGMGEVYRAHDARLNREVALKVLPEIFASDPGRMARFEREARVLAALNHPNIAAIYGLEEFGSGRALVMELVTGETLADRIAKGPIPLDEALPIAKQVAEALEYAHDHGVIHRDLKPANIKVTADGTVKVLDFGLAKALMDEPVAADPRDSPTLSMAPTMTGVILGTAAYMSPEQAKGKPVDRRADIWAFGVVLFEMLTGKPVYSGETAAETLAAVMKEDPGLGVLPTNTPSSIRNLLRRCLEKNSRRRLQHIGEARIVVEDILLGAVPPEQVAVERKGLRANARIGWSVATVLILAFVAAVGSTYFRRETEGKQAVRFFVSPPEGWNLTQILGTSAAAPTPIAVSPDGRQIAFVATGADGKSLLWVRPLDTLAARPLAGTNGAALPFWSPDSQALGFFADGKLKKIDVSSSAAVTLCDAATGFGGAWSRDGIIVFAKAGDLAIQRVSAAGGAPTVATKLGEGERGQRRPSFLPDGRHFLYYSIGGPVVSGVGYSVYLASLDSAERTLLLKADSQVLYSQGHLLFLRENTLMAQPFDAHKLKLAGEAFPIAEAISTQAFPPVGIFSASENGVLAYQTGAAEDSLLAWFDRSGKQASVVGDSARYDSVELSPDDKRASVSIREETGRVIWIYDLERGLRTRFTFDSADENTPIWSADGSRIVFTSSRKGHQDLYLKPSNGAATQEVLFADSDSLSKTAQSWSPDGKFIIYDRVGEHTGFDLFVLPLSGDRKPYPFLQTQFNERRGSFSPDGRWVAYASDESGRYEVYVAPFPGPGGKWQVSTGGGNSPRWRHDGTELFYRAPDDTLMVAAVNGKGESFGVGVVKSLFQARTAGTGIPYDVSADGQHFLLNTFPEQTASAPITIVLNWTAGLKK